MIGLYVNIPFYDRQYNFLNTKNCIESQEELINNYITNLLNEINSSNQLFTSVVSIYIGGGLPLSIPLNELERLLKLLKYITPQEFTVEVDINSINKEKLKLLKKYNVNRLSIKLVTFNNKLLEELNMNYNSKDISRKIKMIKEMGFKNVNIDMSFGIPGQSLTDLKADLRQLKRHNFNHISYYLLEMEEESLYQNKELNNELIAEMYEVIVKELKLRKYEHYEISHFTNNKKYSIQNLLYWNLDEYIGFGLNATSFYNNTLYLNTNDINSYNKGEYLQEKLIQTVEDNINTYLIFGLSQLKGINLIDFENKYKVNILTKYQELNTFIDEKLLEIKDHTLKLTTKGLLYSGMIMEVFV